MVVTLPPDLLLQHTRLMGQLGPQTRAWIRQQARQIVQRPYFGLAEQAALQSAIAGRLPRMEPQIAGAASLILKGLILTEALEAAGDGSQTANAAVPSLVQNQRQTLQMLSNISKILSDTAMALIRKIGG